MAEPSRRRLPASFQRDGVALDHVMVTERVLEVQRERKGDGSSTAELEDEVSSYSMSSEDIANDDLLDLEEEYRREMEEERLADEKNGHFTESPSSENLRSSPQGKVAAHVLEVFARVAHSSSMHLDSHAGKMGNTASAGGSHRNSREISGNSGAFFSEDQGNNLNADHGSLNSNSQLGVTTRGGVESDAKLRELHDFEDAILAKNIQPINMISEEDFIGFAESPNWRGGEERGITIDDMEEDCMTRGNSTNHAEMDLLEARTLVGQQLPDPNLGCHAVASSTSQAQVPLLIPSNLIHPPNALPNATNPAQTKLKQQPAHILSNINSQPKQTSSLASAVFPPAQMQSTNHRKMPKPPLPRLPAQTKVQKSTAAPHTQSLTAQMSSTTHTSRAQTKGTTPSPEPRSSINTNEHAAPLVSGTPNSSPHIDKKSGTERIQGENMMDVEMEEFPLLASAVTVQRGVHAGFAAPSQNNLRADMMETDKT